MYIVNAVCFVYTCRRLIDLSLIAAARHALRLPAAEISSAELTELMELTELKQLFDGVDTDGLITLDGASFQWKNPDLLLKNSNFLLRNSDFPFKNVDFIIKTVPRAAEKGRPWGCRGVKSQRFPTVSYPIYSTFTLFRSPITPFNSSFGRLVTAAVRIDLWPGLQQVRNAIID